MVKGFERNIEVNCYGHTKTQVWTQFSKSLRAHQLDVGCRRCFFGDPIWATMGHQ